MSVLNIVCTVYVENMQVPSHFCYIIGAVIHFNREITSKIRNKVRMTMMNDDTQHRNEKRRRESCKNIFNVRNTRVSNSFFIRCNNNWFNLHSFSRNVSIMIILCLLCLPSCHRSHFTTTLGVRVTQKLIPFYCDLTLIYKNFMSYENRQIF